MGGKARSTDRQYAPVAPRGWQSTGRASAQLANSSQSLRAGHVLLPSAMFRCAITLPAGPQLRPQRLEGCLFWTYSVPSFPGDYFVYSPPDSSQGCEVEWDYDPPSNVIGDAIIPRRIVRTTTRPPSTDWPCYGTREFHNQKTRNRQRRPSQRCHNDESKNAARPVEPFLAPCSVAVSHALPSLTLAGLDVPGYGWTGSRPPGCPL